jgi:TatD DNase family protein
MRFIDTHCHLYLEDFDTDRPIIMQNAFTAGVEAFYLPAIHSATLANMLATEAAYPLHCKAMIGLHPCYVKENYEQELLLVEEWLAKRKFMAVGEIGLDFHWDTSFVPQQYIAFEKQILLAYQYKLPIAIHARDATTPCIEIIQQHHPAAPVLGVFHCFSGTLAEAQKIIELGFFFGIGGVVTYKNSGLDKVLTEIPLQYLVLETDAPYLAPVPFRGKRNESSYLPYIAQKIADIKGVTVEEVAAITTLNAEKLFGT